MADLDEGRSCKKKCVGVGCPEERGREGEVGVEIVETLNLSHCRGYAMEQLFSESEK